MVLGLQEGELWVSAAPPRFCSFRQKNGRQKNAAVSSLKRTIFLSSIFLSKRSWNRSFCRRGIGALRMGLE